MLCLSLCLSLAGGCYNVMLMCREWFPRAGYAVGDSPAGVEGRGQIPGGGLAGAWSSCLFDEG